MLTLLSWPGLPFAPPQKCWQLQPGSEPFTTLQGMQRTLSCSWLYLWPRQISGPRHCRLHCHQGKVGREEGKG